MLQKCSSALLLTHALTAETPSAFSWQARSLTNLAADHFVSVIRDNGLEANVPTFEPPASELHYRDPVYYGEMLHCVAAIEQKS